MLRVHSLKIKRASKKGKTPSSPRPTLYLERRLRKRISVWKGSAEECMGAFMKLFFYHGAQVIHMCVEGPPFPPAPPWREMNTRKASATC